MQSGDGPMQAELLCVIDSQTQGCFTNATIVTLFDKVSGTGTILVAYPIHLRGVNTTGVHTRHAGCLQNDTSNLRYEQVNPVISHLIGTVLAEGLLSMMQLAGQAPDLLLKVSHLLPPFCLCNATPDLDCRPASSASSLTRHATVANRLQASCAGCPGIYHIYHIYTCTRTRCTIWDTQL